MTQPPDIWSTESSTPPDDASPSIGELSVVYRGLWQTATLGGDLRWRSEIPELIDMLGPASGVDLLVKAKAELDATAVRRLGRHALYRAAGRVRGRVRLSADTPDRQAVPAKA